MFWPRRGFDALCGDLRPGPSRRHFCRCASRGGVTMAASTEDPPSPDAVLIAACAAVRGAVAAYDAEAEKDEPGPNSPPCSNGSASPWNASPRPGRARRAGSPRRRCCSTNAPRRRKRSVLLFRWRTTPWRWSGKWSATDRRAGRRCTPTKTGRRAAPPRRSLSSGVCGAVPQTPSN